MRNAESQEKNWWPATSGDEAPARGQGGRKPVPRQPLVIDAEPAPHPQPPAPGTARRARKAAERVDAPRAHSAARARHPLGSSLSAELLTRRVKPTPKTGWRKALYVSTGHLVNPGQAPAEVREADTDRRIASPIAGDYRVAVGSAKGGVGKSTLTTALGSVFARTRTDHVIAVEAVPDRGSLAERVDPGTERTVRSLLARAGEVARAADVREHTGQNPDRLELLAAPSDAAAPDALTDTEYLAALGILRTYYGLILTDCGAGLRDPVISGALTDADRVVVVTTPALDALHGTAATLDWLGHRRGPGAVSDTVVVVNHASPGRPQVDVAGAVAWLRERGVASVHEVPFDPHLAEGSVVRADLLRKRTLAALRALAVDLAAGFPARAKSA